jgi:Histidine kinase-like ATPase domain
MPEVNDILPCEPESARRARQQLEPFGEVLDETRFGDLRLLVSELVAEAIGGLGASRSDQIRIQASSDPKCVRATVEGGSGSYRVPSAPPEPGEAGWGVYLVQRLSDGWGLRRERGRAAVWFQLKRRQDTAAL